MMNRDDTNYLTREDMWRELELLPVWKLRAPVEALLATEIENVKVSKFETAQVTIIAIEEPTIEKPINAAEIHYEITLSEDKHWAFIHELAGLKTLDIGLQNILFKNILHALSIEKPSKMQVTNVADVQASIVVAMGESVAQALLNTQASSGRFTW